MSWKSCASRNSVCVCGQLCMYIQRSPHDNTTCNAPERDRPQHDRPGACIIAQQYSSAIFGPCVLSSKKEFGSFKKCCWIFPICFQISYTLRPLLRECLFLKRDDGVSLLWRSHSDRYVCVVLVEPTALSLSCSLYTSRIAVGRWPTLKTVWSFSEYSVQYGFTASNHSTTLLFTTQIECPPPQGNVSAVFLGAFAKSQKATVRFVLSVCPSALPSVRMEQLGTPCADFHEVLHLSIFRKSVGKVQASLKSDKNDRHFTWRPIYIIGHISLSSS